MMKLVLGTAVLAVVMSGSALAQERAAGQANDAQVNWSALSAKLDAIDHQNKAIAASVTTLQGSVNGINTKLDAIAACGAQQKVWNGTGCVDYGSGLRWVANGVVTWAHSNNVYTNRQRKAAATPTCTANLGTKCSTRGQSCLSGTIANMTFSSGGVTSGGSPNSSRSPETIPASASWDQGLALCTDQ